MKVKINASGNLTIRSENSLEAYALRKWSEENKDKIFNEIIINTSLPPMAGILIPDLILKCPGEKMESKIDND